MARSVAFYRDLLGFAVEATYDDPPYATLIRDGVRLSLAEQGHAAEDRPGVAMVAPPGPLARATSVLVLEVADALGVHATCRAAGVPFLAAPYSPAVGRPPLLRASTRTATSSRSSSRMRAVVLAGAGGPPGRGGSGRAACSTPATPSSG